MASSAPASSAPASSADSSSSSSLLRPRTALVLGGTGFISRHCVEHLLAHGAFSVTIVTRGRTKDEFGTRVRRIVADRSKRTAFRTALAGTRWDLVIDCIAYVPADLEPLVALHAAHQFECDLFVHISTDSVYQVCRRGPGRKGMPIREDEIALLDLSEKKLRARDDYGYEKWLCERTLREAHGASGFPFVALRLPDVLGEKEVPVSRHYRYQKRVAARLPVELGSDADLAVSFVWAQDVARACIALHEDVLARGPKLVGRAFNIGSVETPTMREYVSSIAATLAVPVRIDAKRAGHQFLPSVQCGVICMDALRDALSDWEPTPLATWLKRTVRWYARHADDMEPSSETSSSGSGSGSESGSRSGS